MVTSFEVLRKSKYTSQGVKINLYHLQDVFISKMCYSKTVVLCLHQQSPVYFLFLAAWQYQIMDVFVCDNWIMVSILLTK